MIEAPSFLKILFFILSMLAPADTAKIAMSPTPTLEITFTKTATGSWALNQDASEWKVDGEFVTVHSTKGDGKDSRVKIAPFVGDAPDAAKTLAAHDWAKEKSLKLSKALTVEKSDGGFIFHMQKTANEPAMDLQVIFTK